MDLLHSHIPVKSSPGVAIFRQDILFDIHYLANWNKIEEYRQAQTSRNVQYKNASRVDFDYTVSIIVLFIKMASFAKQRPNTQGLFVLLWYIQMEQLQNRREILESI